MIWSSVSVALIAAALFLTVQTAQAAVDIGVAAAVRPQATGTPPDQESRILNVGLDLFADERIDTGPKGQTHLLFRDGSSISIGPNASLVLDEFVYDPDSKTGSLSVSVTRGVFRFVGGRISKTKSALFKTPTATMGIRGGVAIMEANSPEDVAAAQQQGQDLNPASVTMLYGEEVFMDNGESRQTMNRPGFTLVQTPAGQLTPPVPASQQQLNAALSTLEEPQQGEEDEDGGAAGLGAIAPAAGGPTVSDNDVSNSQLSELGSSNSPDAFGGGAPDTGAPAIANTGNATEEASQQQAIDGAARINRPISALIDADVLANLVAENAPIGELVGIMAMALEPDAIDSVTFALLDSAGNRFAIDPVTGKVSVANGELLDFESATSHGITIQATSTDGSTLSLSLTISVSDDNTEFTISSILDTDAGVNQISELASNGAGVGIMGFASDADGSDSVTYSLLDNAGGRFAIDPQTGIVTVADASLLATESNTTHTITVLAQSTDGSFADQTFTIEVIAEITEGGGGSSPVIVGRARCCEDNGTGTDDGTATRDFIITNASINGTALNATGTNGAFTLNLPNGNGVFALGASGVAPFDAGFGTLQGGTVTSLFDQEFMFYELSGTTGVRAIFLAGVPTPENAIPSSGFSIYTLFDDITGTDSPNVNQAPFVRHSSAGVTSDNTRAYFTWDDGGGQEGFGVGRVVINGTGTTQVAATSVITGKIDTGIGGKTFLDGYQRGALRISAGNPRHFDGRIASLPLSSDLDHFLATDFPSGFHLGAGTANDGAEPAHTGITRRHGDGSNDFTDRPNSVGVLSSHSATTANSRNTSLRYGYAGGVLAYYLESSTSTAPDGYQPFVTRDSPPAVLPFFFVSSSANLNQIDAQLNGTLFDNNEVDLTFVLNFGGLNNVGSSVFVDDKIFMAIENPVTPGTTDGGNNVLSTATTRSHLTTAHNFEHTGFQGATTFCTCSFLTWGFLGFDLIDPASGDIGRSQLATWVIGNNFTRNLAQFPDGNATYNGHVFGTVGQGPTVYAAVGDLSMNLNFAAGQVSINAGAITNFDGGTYTMSTQDAINPFGVGANLSLVSKTGYSAGEITGRFVGSFFGTGSPPENIAGNFRLEKTAGIGADYDAGGIGMAEIVSP